MEMKKQSNISGRDLVILSGNANIPLAENVCNYLSGLPDYLGKKLDEVSLTKFSDGESDVVIKRNVRGSDAFVIQPGAYPANENLMDLLIMIDALKRASARRITAVLPYYPYARKDRKDKPRVPITAKLVADLITAAGADRVLTIDLHAGQIQGFFDIPVDNLYARPVLINHLMEKFDHDNLVVVSPDAGGMERARNYGKFLRCGIAMIDKRRPKDKHNTIDEMNVVGEVKNKIAVLIDDMIDTAETLVKAGDALLQARAKAVYAYTTHAVFSGQAIEKIINSPIKSVAVTDTLPLSKQAKQCDKIISLSIADLLAEAIRRTHEEDSVSGLFS